MSREVPGMALPAPSCSALFAALSHVLDPGGEALCVSLLELPDKSVEPGYYEAVEAPISLGEIAQRLYPTPAASELGVGYTQRELRRDLRRLFNNTKKGMAADSPAVHAATRLEV